MAEAVKKNEQEKPEAPEKLRYSRYYEHDGALKAYANRMLWLATFSLPTTLLALGFAVYVRLQPPTVIRVDSKGDAAVVGAAGSTAIEVAEGSQTAATDYEKKAFVRAFLQSYLAFEPDTVNRNWASALNMMTTDLRQTTLTAIQKSKMIEEIQNHQTRSELEIKNLDADEHEPMTFGGFVVRKVRRMDDHQEATDQLVEQFHVRLAQEKRSVENPSGLLIAEYWEQKIQGQQGNSVKGLNDTN